ncbi:hypothetical protein [Streptomyces olindensis]|uniref:hypothetical protein n=1 Tax=Streptomyces olindensis TaxID=358823 RepID=UPI0036535D06
MSWTRRPLTVLAVCALLAGAAGCGSGDTPGGGTTPTPAGRLLEDRDKEGRPYREVEAEDAPDVGVEVQPGRSGGWDVRLTVRNFRFSPAGAAARAVAGRGLAHLYVDGRLVARLRAPGHRLAAGLVPRGTHHVTARLYADDGTVWAVDGRPVESTADITASGPAPGARPSAAARRGVGASVVTSGAGRQGAGVPVVSSVTARQWVRVPVVSSVIARRGAEAPVVSSVGGRQGVRVPGVSSAIARQRAGASVGPSVAARQGAAVPVVVAWVQSGGRGSPGRAGKAS